MSIHIKMSSSVTKFQYEIEECQQCSFQEVTICLSPRVTGPPSVLAA